MRTGAEIKLALDAFVTRWSGYSGTERAEAQTFLNELFECYGSNRKDVGARFEEFRTSSGFMDLFWPEVLIVEMKHPRQPLERAAELRSANSLIRSRGPRPPGPQGRPPLGRPDHPARRGGEPHRQAANRLATAIEAGEAHQEVWVAWRSAQDMCAAKRTKDEKDGRRQAEKILATLHACQIPEGARLGRTLRKWREAFPAHFTTGRANNGIIELHCRVARGHRNYDNYRLRMRPRRRRTHPLIPTRCPKSHQPAAQDNE